MHKNEIVLLNANYKNKTWKWKEQSWPPFEKYRLKPHFLLLDSDWLFNPKLTELPSQNQPHFMLVHNVNIVFSISSNLMLVWAQRLSRNISLCQPWNRCVYLLHSLWLRILKLCNYVSWGKYITFCNFDTNPEFGLNKYKERVQFVQPQEVLERELLQSACSLGMSF